MGWKPGLVNSRQAILTLPLTNVTYNPDDENIDGPWNIGGF
jgi:hypothetical protein